MNLHYTAVVVFLTVLLQIWLMVLVGRARGRYGIKAPAISGHPDFERSLRIQANTVENLLMFLPALWLCATYLGDCWAAGAGAAWLIGRVLYALGYQADAAKRTLGFMVSSVAIVALLAGGGYGLVHVLLG